MASFPGTSSSSGGGGDQPSNKRIRVETDSPQDSSNSSSSESDPESSQDSIHSNQSGSLSSATRVQTEHLKCPVCTEYPRKEVYQCDEGHIVCHECIAKITRCGVCRAIYPNKKIRSRIAETELDELIYKCSFRDDGCLMKDIPRNRRTAHEIQCDRNPTKPGFKFCSLFDTTPACPFRVDPDSILQDPGHRKDVIEHLTRPPHNLLLQKVKIGERRSFLFPLIASLPFAPIVLFEVYDSTGKTVGYYVLIRRVSTQTNLSFTVVGFNSAPEDLDGGTSHRGKITAMFSITAKTDLNKSANDGNVCVPNLTWTVKSKFLNKWKDFMNIRSEDRPLFSFYLPLTFLSDFYKQPDGRFNMMVIFGPLE